MAEFTESSNTEESYRDSRDIHPRKQGRQFYRLQQDISNAQFLSFGITVLSGPSISASMDRTVNRVKALDLDRS